MASLEWQEAARRFSRPCQVDGCRIRAWRRCRVCERWACKGHRFGAGVWFRCPDCSPLELAQLWREAMKEEGLERAEAATAPPQRVVRPTAPRPATGKRVVAQGVGYVVRRGSEAPRRPRVGGPPEELLERLGLRADPALRPAPPPPDEDPP